MNLKKLIKPYFFLSKAEQNGTVVLLVILVIVIIIRFLVPHLIKDDEDYLAEIERKILLLEQQQDSINSARFISDNKKQTADKVDIEYFTFNPNVISKDSLLLLGFSNRVASTLIKYRNKGGRFYKPNDLKRVYGVDSVLYAVLEDYIVIPKKEYKKEVEKKNFPKEVENKKLDRVIDKVEQEKLKQININVADSAEWTTLRGIGPVYASRICKFRNYLGGFVRVEQLKEVYGFSEETFQKIEPFLCIDTTLVQKINLNFANINDLKKHPYCNYKLARKIIDYRSEHGSLSSVALLATDSVISEYDFHRFSPYLSIK